MAHFYFRARQDNSRVQLGFYGDQTALTVNLEYSYDETNWSIWYKDTTLQSGQTLYLRGDNPDGWHRVVVTENYSYFKTTSGTFNIGGDLSYLVSVTGTNSVPTQYCFKNLFKGCTGIVECESGLLSGLTILNRYCYESMFVGCNSLITAPALPATTLAQGCYSNMFAGCNSLTTTPVLPATTLAQSCYSQMFKLCTSLTTAPELPATALTEYCYMWMFSGCTALTTAPELPATTLAQGCYSRMFNGCTNLNYIKCLATDISASNCTNEWVDGVANSGTFVKDVNMTGWTRGVSAVPENWNLIDDAPSSMSTSPTSITGVTYEGEKKYTYPSYTNIDLTTVTATTAADWIDLDWLDDSTKARLDIDIDENFTSSARTATIQITGRGYDSQSHTANVTVQQEARPQGTITPNPATVNAQWLDDDDYFVNVDFSGFSSNAVTLTTGGSEDFIYNLDWRTLEVSGGSMFQFKCDTNSGLTSRTGYIYITGTDDYDNTITATVTVIQKVVNRNPIWKDVYYTGSTSTLDYYVLDDNSTVIYQGRAYVQPDQSNVKINISKICQNYLNNDIEDGNEFIDGLGLLTYGNNAVRTFSLYNASGDTLLEEYTYFYNWSYKELDNNLTLTTPINGHADSRMVKVGTEVVLEDNLYLNHTISNLYTNGYCGDYALYYLQRNGGWAAFLIEGNSKKTDNYEKYFYNMAFDNNMAMFEKNTYHNQITSSWELHTGWLTDEQAQNLAFNLLSSNRVFLHDFKANKVIPVVLTDNEAEYKTFKNNGNHLINFTITAEESQRKQLI